MSMLTRTELEELLRDKEPGEIRKQYADRLDVAGNTLLDEHEQDLRRAETYLNEAGRSWREAMPPAPDPGLPNTFDTRTYQEWWRRGGALSVFSAAAALFLGLLLPKPWHGKETKLEREIPQRARSSSFREKELKEINDRLMNTLIERGNLFLELGNETNPDDHQLRNAFYNGAFLDFQEALLLDEDNVTAMEYMVKACEKLGKLKEAEEYLEKIMSLEDTP